MCSSMEEPMPRWVKDFKASINQKFNELDVKLHKQGTDLQASINQTINQKINELRVELHEQVERLDRLLIKRKDTTKLKPVQENNEVANHKNDEGETESKMQENDGVADHKSDERETESKPMDLEDLDEVKVNKVEAINIDQSEQNCDEVFKLSTDKIDGENVSELVINGEGFKDAIIVPYYSLFPSTTTIFHTSAPSPPLLVFVLNPLYSPPCHNLYLICWKDHTSSDDSWSSKDKLRWFDPDLFKRYQSGLLQDPIDSTPFDPGGIADDHVASSRGDHHLATRRSRVSLTPGE